MKQTTFYLLLFLFLSYDSYSQFSPNFRNFTITEYKAGNQNWDISRDENGKVYVANNMGLLEYDGMDWKLFQLPNKTIVRSVITYENLIFTGSFEEFGYWEEDEFGNLNYNSLSKLLKDQIAANEEIWQILHHDGKIYFKSFSSIYIYDFVTLEKISPASAVISLSLVEEELFVSTLYHGIFKVKDNRLIPFYNDDTLSDTKVISITKKEEQYIIWTSLKGSFYLNSAGLQPTNYSINESIKQHQLNKFSILRNGDMVFGTIKNGVYITNKEIEVKYHLSKESGLENNTVLCQFVDYENNLWLGLDNGIAKVDLKSARYFKNYISDKLGAVYNIINYQDLLYIGTNIGLFYLDKNNNLNFVEGSQGQVWDLQIIDNDLLCGHNEGTFLVKKGELKKISEYTGGWILKKVPQQDNLYIQGTYTGLVKFQKINGEWEAKHLGRTTIPSRFLVFENPYTAWVAHTYKGVYKFNFDKNFDTITRVTNYGPKGLDSDFNLRVYKLKNDIVFKTDSGWEKYEPILDSIIPFDILNKKLGRDAYIISEQSVNPLVLKDKNDIIKFKYINNDSIEKRINKNKITNQLIINYESASKIDTSLFALNFYNGFMVIDESFKDSTSIYKPTVESIKINRKKIKLESLQDNRSLAFNHNDTLSIELSSPKSTNHSFEYKIPSLSDDWMNIENKMLILKSINNGRYNVLIRARDKNEKVSEAQTVLLTINPPWYKGIPGILLYALLLLTAVALFYTLHQRKIRKEQQIIRNKYLQAQKELLLEKEIENEKKIVSIKNENLQNELKLKSKQLANNAIALVKKNEALHNIKTELTDNKENFKNFYFYKKIVKKLNNSIEHNNEWKVFEDNFNQVHDEFFIKLKAKHSTLTSKDLKLSAYIKLKFTNKEIAPLMNISVRGVETHRYRLKKKMDLKKDVSLADYLLNFK